MMIYITQGNFTHQFITGMMASPEDRESAVRALVEASGAKMLHYFITFGDYDFMIISEGELGPEEYASALVVAGASGAVADMKTTIAISTAQSKAMFEKAATIAGGYSVPGQG